jgi:hypothetical protein
MNRRLKVVVGAVATVVVVAASTVAVGWFAFERRIDREVDQLLAAGGGIAGAIVTEADLAALPDPVRRWLRWAGVVGTARPAVVRLTQEGRFRQGEDQGWMPFTAEEVYTTNPPGFLWSTRMRMAPGLSIVGRDRYAEGRGSIEMRLLGVVTVAEASGERLDQGALLRYLNETMWFPAAVLSPSITWEAVDARSARATMSHAGITASAVFVFDDEGRRVDMIAERYDLGSDWVQTWSTPITAYGEFNGISIPTEGTGVWKYESGDFAYIELRITGVAYNEVPLRKW